MTPSPKHVEQTEQDELDQLAAEVSQLRRVKRNPAAAAATYAAITGQPSRRWFGVGWRTAAATLVAVVLIVPAAFAVGQGESPLAPAQWVVEEFTGQHERSPSPSPSPTATESSQQQNQQTQQAPAGIEQAPVSAPAVLTPTVRTVPQWLKKQIQQGPVTTVPSQAVNQTIQGLLR